MDPSQGDMSATNLRLLNKLVLHPHQPQVALTYKLSIKTSDHSFTFFFFFFFNPAYLSPGTIFIFCFYFPFSKAASNVSRRTNCPIINITESVCLICLKKKNKPNNIPTINFWMLHDYRSNTVNQMNVLRSSCKKEKKNLTFGNIYRFFLFHSQAVRFGVGGFFFFQISLLHTTTMSMDRKP